MARFAALRARVRSRLERQAAIRARRPPLAVLPRQPPQRPRLRRADRLLWGLLSQIWPDGRQAVQIVTPETGVRWHRRACARTWRWRSCRRGPGRPAVNAHLRALIRRRPAAHPRWGAPRRHADLQTRGLDVSQATLGRSLARPRGPRGPSAQTGRACLANPVAQIASCACVTAPTATVRILFVFVILSHARRNLVHVTVSAHPPAAWTVQPLRAAWPADPAPPRVLRRDRDGLSAPVVRHTRDACGVEDGIPAPRAPSQPPFVDRLIGPVRRVGLDHGMIWNARGRRRHLRESLASSQRVRPHRSLDTEAPVPRPGPFPTLGRIVAVAPLGGVPHHDDRRACS